MQQLKLHPDLGGDTWNAALINSAYRALSRPQTRRQHDLELAERGLTPKMIGVGPLKDYVQHAATERHHNVNRRQYARVLQLQLDAEHALIKTAHNWAISAGATDTHAALVERAYRLLDHRETRDRYTTLLTTLSHTDALAALQVEAAEWAKANEHEHNTEHPDGTQCDHSGCPFCDLTPLRATLTPEPVCARCFSPLSEPPNTHSLMTNARRQVPRVNKADEVVIRAGWPASRHRGYLVDASPHGVSFLTASKLDLHRVVRVEGAGLVAVLELLHSSNGTRINRYGGRFLSAAFDQPQGTFFNKTA